MNPYRYRIYAAVLLLAVLSFVESGCMNRTASPAPGDGRTRAQSAGDRTYGPRDGDANGKANHLAAIAKAVNGVKDANCVVFGNTAVVGIDVDPKMDRSRVGTLKYAVAEALRKDPYGANAVVTADVDMTERIREIGADIRRGRPVQGFAEELGDIVGRIVPQVPQNPPPGAQAGR